MAIEIFDLAIGNGDFSVRYVMLCKRLPKGTSLDLSPTCRCVVSCRPFLRWSLLQFYSGMHQGAAGLICRAVGPSPGWGLKTGKGNWALAKRILVAWLMNADVQSPLDFAAKSEEH